MNEENRNRLIDAENILTVARWELSGWDGCEKGKGIKSTNWLLRNSPGDVKYSMGNVVNNIVITMYGVRWV